MKLDSRVLENIRIPLPELDEQRRIAAILDLAANQRTGINSMLRLQDELIGSLQSRAFRGEL